MGESPNETPDPLDSVESALRHAMAAGRVYAGEMQKRARRLVVWAIVAVALGIVAIMGIIFLLAGVAEWVQSSWGPWAGGGKMLVGVALVVVFIIFLAFRGGGEKR